MTCVLKEVDPRRTKTGIRGHNGEQNDRGLETVDHRVLRRIDDCALLLSTTSASTPGRIVSMCSNHHNSSTWSCEATILADLITLLTLACSHKRHPNLLQAAIDSNPEKLPGVMNLVHTAVRDVQDHAMPPTDSGNLGSCSTPQVPEMPKWMLGSISKNMVYLDRSLQMDILENGIKVTAVVNSTFSTPLWLGVCAWASVVTDPPPKILKEIHGAMDSLTLYFKDWVRNGLPNIDEDSDCDNWSAKVYTDWFLLSDRAEVQTGWDTSSLTFALGAAYNGYSFGVDLLLVVNYMRAHYRARLGFPAGCSPLTSCDDDHVTMTSRIHLDVEVECNQCGIQGKPSTVQYRPKVTFPTGIRAITSCGKVEGTLQDVANSFAQTSPAAIELALIGYLSKLSSTEQAVTCGCVEICPSNAPGSWLNGSFQTIVQTTVAVDMIDGQAKFTATDTSAEVPDPVKVSFCGPSANFYGQEENIRNQIVTGIQNTVASQLAGQASSASMPISKRIFADLDLFATVHSGVVEFSNASTAVANQPYVAAVTTALIFENGTSYAFANPDAQEAGIIPPDTNWHLQTGTDANPVSAIRLSTTTFNAIVGAANILGMFENGFNMTVLDAVLQFNMTFQEPVFSVPADEDLQLYLPRGSLAVTCLNNCHNFTEDYGNMIEFWFSDVYIHAALDLLRPDTVFQIILQVDNFDFRSSSINPVRPEFPLPKDLLVQLLKTAMKKQIPHFNSVLQDHPLILNKEVSDFLHFPVIRVMTQKEPPCCKHWIHGFIEIDDYLTESEKFLAKSQSREEHGKEI